MGTTSGRQHGGAPPVSKHLNIISYKVLSTILLTSTAGSYQNAKCDPALLLASSIRSSTAAGLEDDWIGQQVATKTIGSVSTP
jgi:hypothetical protein